MSVLSSRHSPGSFAVYAHFRKSFKFPLDGDLGDSAVRESLRDIIGGDSGGFDDVVPARTKKGYFSLRELRGGRTLIELGPEDRPFTEIKAFDFEGGSWFD